MIKVLNYIPMMKGAIVGQVDVLIDDKRLPMVIRRIAHLKKGDREWFNFPQFKEDGPNPAANGAPFEYVRYCEYGTMELNSRFLEALRTAVAAYLSNPPDKSDPFDGEKPTAEEAFRMKETIEAQEPTLTQQELGW